MSMAEKALTVNLEALCETELCDREEEIRKLRRALETGANVYVFGPLGCGKTTAVRQAIEEFKCGEVLFIDGCASYTRHAVLSQVVSQINERFSPKILLHTRSNPEIVERLKKDREKYPTLRYVALDNFERLEQPTVIYNLLQVGFKIILVSNDGKAVNKLVNLPESPFPSVVEFIGYTGAQVADIIRDKAIALVGKEHFSNEAVGRIAFYCGGNIAHGIDLLVASAILAASRGKSAIEESDVPEQRYDSISTYDEELLLHILKEKRRLKAGDLYKQYCERSKMPKTPRTLRYHLENLVHRNLIRASGNTSDRVYEIVGA